LGTSCKKKVVDNVVKIDEKAVLLLYRILCPPS